MLLEFIIRKLKFLNNTHAFNEDTAATRDDKPSAAEIKNRLSENLKSIKEMLGDGSDLKTNLFHFGPDDHLSGAMMFIDGLVDNHTLTDAILRPIKNWQPADKTLPTGENLANELAQNVLCAGDIETVSLLEELASGCLSGDTVVLLDGCPTGLIVSTKGWDKRGVAEPQSESVVRGPREGFTENLRTNTALIRRKIKNGQLHMESMKVGRRTRTNVCLIYLSDVADAKVVETVKYRINRLDVDSILESGYIEEYIEDAPFSPFATVGYSEKPDVIASRILEGRVAIVVDGTPFVLTVPMLFIESFQSADDYYGRTIYSSMMRILRYIAYFITVFAPGIYIALTTFHQELIPTTLLFTIANAREGTPFPVFIEMAIMVFAFEILREAGIRLPRPVGQAISIVGALVMGEAAVSAGLVGAPVVITIALTAVCGFLVSPQNDSASILRILIMCLGVFAGWYSIFMGFLAILLHLGSLTSFGVPYFDGFAWTRNLQDSLIRMPLWSMVQRPKGIARGDITRRHFFIPPLRPYEDDERKGRGV